MENSILENRDYTLILDRSSSMTTPDQRGGMSRWEALQESTLALARKCEEFDADGLTIYLFSDRFERFESVNSTQVAQLFKTHPPAGGTNLIPALQHAINHYFQRKAAGQSKAGGETFIILTDGAPHEPLAVSETIINTTERMEREDELAVSFIQVGSEEKATRFLKALDDQLQGVGAKFDICDTVALEDMEDMPLAEVLIRAITD